MYLKNLNTRLSLKDIFMLYLALFNSKAMYGIIAGDR